MFPERDDKGTRRLRNPFGGAFALALLLALVIIPVGIFAPRGSGETRVAAPPPIAREAATPATLEQLTQDAAAVAGPSIVKIESSSGLGSGVIVDPRGYIVTNYHVLFGQGGQGGQADGATPRYTVTLSSGASHRATVAGTDVPDDLAMLKIDARGLKAMPLADSARLRVGQFVLAVGNPLGYSQSVTFGIVSTLRRTVAENGPATFIPDMIQTSAPINPGNSGGALVDLRGRLVGIPTLAAADPRLGTAAQGIGFAIPSNRVSFITGQIIKDGKVTHSGRPYLGVADLHEVTPILAARNGLRAENGVLVGHVERDGPADRAGLRAGDVIVRLDGRATLSDAALGDALAHLKPGQRAPLVLNGESGARTVTITLGELPVH